MEDFEEEERLPPTAERVLRRAFCLSAIVCRSFIDERNRDEESKSINNHLIPWLREVDAEPELERWEAEMLAQPLGTIDLKTRVNGTWISESLLILAWALRRFEIPSHDVAIDPQDLTDALDFLSPEAKFLFASAELREHSEIEEAAERAFHIHWRLREFSLRHAPMDFVQFATKRWFGSAIDLEGIEIAENDLAINGMPISKASEADFFHTLSIARERHRAFNWLLGDNPVFSEVDTST